MSTKDDLELAYYASLLGLTAQQVATMSRDDILNKFFANPPAQGGELAYAENVSGTTQAIAAGGNADVTACQIVVPVTLRPVYIEAQCRIHFTGVTGTPAPTNPAAVLVIYDVTSGRTAVEICGHPSFTAATGSPGMTLRAKARVGILSAQKTYLMNVIAPGSASNGYPIQVDNAASIRSYIGAYLA